MSALPSEFGVIVRTDRMAPVYDPGDTIICKPCSSLRAGRDYIVAARGSGRLALGPPDSTPTMMRIVRIERLTDTHLFAREFNPARVRRMSRSKWKAAAKVTGVYRGDPRQRARPGIRQ